jgi:hypothetical protein
MQRIDDLDWPDLERELDGEGQVRVPGLLTGAECSRVCAADLATADGPLPTPLGALRDALYARLVPVADRWCEALHRVQRHPAHYAEFAGLCRRAGQVREQSAITRLRIGDYAALRQHVEGDLLFPLAVTILLSAPGADFTGGEFALTEQRPRMQSRPIVVPLRRGDAAIFAVRHRPHRGPSGIYRVNLSHAVSRIRSGERVALDLVFHGAPRAA